MEHRPPLPWERLGAASVLATAVLVLMVLLNVAGPGGGNVLSLVQPGRSGPAAAVFEQDFPPDVIPDGLGHDGQQFYAVARAPMHLDDVAESLDRPNYRLQRPLLPWLAWLLHPQGGGEGLVWAMFAVGVAAVLGGCLATGALAVTLGLSPRWALAFAAVPGTFAALRISTADNLALALALGAVTLALRRHSGWAVLVAVAAVLAKEPVLLVLLGLAVARRDRRSMVLVAVPAAVAGAWAVVLRLHLGADPGQVTELGWPLQGLIDASATWRTGEELTAVVFLTVAFTLAALALWRSAVRRGALGAVIALQAAFVLTLTPNVVGLGYNASRTLSPLLVCSVLALASTRAPARARALTPLSLPLPGA